MVFKSKRASSKNEENVQVEDGVVDPSGEEQKPSKKEDQIEENGEDIKENGETAVEKKKKPAAKKAKAAVKKPAVEGERKSSRQPKPVLKEEDSNEKSQPQKGRKRNASKSPARSKKSKSAKEEKDYEVEEIVDMRIKKGKKEYKIRWKGYKPSQDTWEPEKHLSCQDLIEKYLTEHEDQVTEIKPKTPAKRSKSSKKSKAK